MRWTRIVAAVSLAVALVAAVGVATAAPMSSQLTTPRFAPSVLVDPFRLGGEPLMDLDSKGNIYISSVIGFSNHTSFLWKSEDGGESFDLLRLDAPGLQRPNRTVGGGDSEIIIGPPAEGQTDDTIAFIDLEGLVTFGTGFSFDGGNTFVNNNVFASGDFPLADRQWGGVWRDPQGVDHYYNFFNGIVTGFTIVETTDYGVTWNDWKRGVTADPSANRPGPLFIDQSTGDLLLTWTAVAGGQGGAGFTRCTQAKVCTDVVIAMHDDMNPNNTFATGAMDRQGNLYVAWSGIPQGDLDPNVVPTRVYMSVSRDKGATWSAPVVASPDVPVASMPAIVAGDAGRVAIVYYGTSQFTDPNDNDGPWFPMMSMTLDGLSKSPAWTTVNVGEHTNHINPICTAGTICAADPQRMNDRNLIDFLYANVGPRGEVLVTWADTAHQVTPEPPKGSPFTMFAKQVSGSSLYADVGTLDPPGLGVLPYSGAASAFGGTIPGNWRSDAASDAPVPRHGPDGTGASVPSLDARAVSIEPAGSDAMRLRMTIADAEVSVPAGADRNLYMVWWWADDKVQYAMAEATAAGIADCYAGEPVVTTRAAPRWALYLRASVPPPSVTTVDCTLDPATGVLTFDVPYSAVDAKAGQSLYSVTGSTYHIALPVSTAANAVALIPEEVDQTTPFTYVVGAARSQFALSSVNRPVRPRPTPPAAAPRPRGRSLPSTGVGSSGLLAVALLTGSLALALSRRYRV